MRPAGQHTRFDDDGIPQRDAPPQEEPTQQDTVAAQLLTGGTFAPVTPVPQRRRVEVGAMSPEQERLFLTARKLALAHEAGDELGVRFKLDDLSGAFTTLDEAAAGSPMT